MRLLFCSVLALGLVGAVAGCGHMAGVCDTEDCGCGCEGGSCGIGGYGMPVESVGPSIGRPAMKPESIRKMPTGDSKLSAPPGEGMPGL
ncbi:MAG TPA: hypothetical protein VG013_05200 [Gemmataceae bacterium]|jgi:hypothetical protein|nr:hypothetical protein [Gemmataceae bacterium]